MKKNIFIFAIGLIFGLISMFFVFKFAGHHFEQHSKSVENNIENHKHEDENHEEKDEHEEHNHSKEISDDELFKAKCEHEILQFECDECRYELGLVKIDDDLIKENVIKTDLIKKQLKENKLDFNGVVNFDENKVFIISSNIDGIIKNNNFFTGKKVKKGELLFQIDSKEYAELKNNYIEQKLNFENYEKIYNKSKELFDSKVISQKEFNESEFNYNSSKLLLNKLLNQLKYLSPVLNTENNSGIINFYSPIEGTIVEINISNGQNVEKNTQLMKIIDTSSINVIFEVNENYLNKITELMKNKEYTVIIKNDYLKENLIGEIDFIYPFVNPETRKVKVKIKINNISNDNLLKQNSFVSIEIFTKNEEYALSVPNSSILSDEGKFFVFIKAKDNYFVRKFIQISEKYSNYSAIENNDLKENDVIVTNGSFLLKSDILREKMGAGCADWKNTKQMFCVFSTMG